MYNYIKDAVINAADVTEVVKAADTDLVSIKGVGTYNKKDKPAAGLGIQNVEVVAGVADVNGKYKVEFTALDGAATSLYHIEIVVKDSRALGEFANANYGRFGKRILFEVNGGADADAVKAAFVEAVKDIKEFIDLATVVATTSSIEFEFVKPTFSISEDGAFVGKLDTTVCPAECQLQDFEEDAAAKVTETAAPVVGTTGEWLIENLRFPTYYNTRYGAPNAKNYPIPGQVYDQVSFQYVMPRVGLGGLSAVSQKIESETTHVIYVVKGQGSVLEGLLG